MNMLAALLRASRPVSWINTAFPFAAAYLLVAAFTYLPWAPTPGERAGGAPSTRKPTSSA